MHWVGLTRDYTFQKKKISELEGKANRNYPKNETQKEDWKKVNRVSVNCGAISSDQINLEL